MRIFRGLLFLGAGTNSMRGVRALHARLDDAVSHLGGMQQPAHPETAEEAAVEERMQAEAQIEIEEAIRDIASALLGREVVFLEKQPYPSNDGEGIYRYMEAREKKRHGRGNPYGT